MALNTAMIAICVGEIKDAVHKAIGLEAKVKTAFQLVQSFWLSTDNDIRWNGALAAVIMDPSITAEEKATLQRSTKVLAAVSAAMRKGSAVDLSPVADEAERGIVLPLRGWWLEAEGQAAERGPDVGQVEALVKNICTQFAGKPAPVQGAALADLLAIWLAGHVVAADDRIDRPATDKLRKDVLAHHLDKVRELLWVNAQRMGTAT